MRLLRSIRKDILWIKSLPPAVKVTGLILGVGLIVGALYLGPEWWTTPVKFKYRSAPRLELLGVVLGFVLAIYIPYVLERDRDDQ